MVSLPRVVKRGIIDSSQITPKGVEALQIAHSNGKIWKYLLIGTYRWGPADADRVIDGLVKGGYIERQDSTISGSRHEYVLTNFGNDVVSKLKKARRGMKVRDLITNMGGGLVRVASDHWGFGMTSGTYFSAPIGLDSMRVQSIEGDPVLGLGTKICPKCREINADEPSCTRCGCPL